ncbi:MAG: methyltransferase [Polyangiaceae bacterium]
MKTRYLPFIALSFAAISCGGSSTPAAQAPSGEASPATDAKLAQAITGNQRTAEERARDNFRHPRETLEFFGVRDNMAVVELSASKGWYTAILGPLLSEKGKLAVTNADPNGPADSEGTKNAKALIERISKDPSLGKVTTIATNWKKEEASLGPDGSADMVLTFRNLHGWIANGVADKVLAASFKVLKSGGVLGVEEHRAKADASSDPKVIGDTGYVPEALVVQLAQKAGFKLAGASEINANPKDTKDYPKGVWTLPPSLQLGDQDKAKYMAIGESDRMTLKFVKP